MTVECAAINKLFISKAYVFNYKNNVELTTLKHV